MDPSFPLARSSITLCSASRHRGVEPRCLAVIVALLVGLSSCLTPPGLLGQSRVEAITEASATNFVQQLHVLIPLSDSQQMVIKQHAKRYELSVRSTREWLEAQFKAGNAGASVASQDSARAVVSQARRALDDSVRVVLSPAQRTRWDSMKSPRQS